MRTASLLIVVPVILAGAMLGRARLREARAVARESSQRALLAEIQNLLDEHGETHGEYPATLTGLALT